MHAYYKIPIVIFMTCTHYCHGFCDLVFPPGQSRIIAGALFQNYKRTIKKNSKGWSRRFILSNNSSSTKPPCTLYSKLIPTLANYLLALNKLTTCAVHHHPRRKQHDPSTKMMMSMIVRLKARFIMKMRFQQQISADK